MKVFWIILGLLAVVGVVIVFAPSGGTPAAPTAAAELTPQQPNAAGAISGPGRGEPEIPGRTQQPAPVATAPVPLPEAQVAEKIDEIAAAEKPAATPAPAPSDSTATAQATAEKPAPITAPNAATEAAAETKATDSTDASRLADAGSPAETSATDAKSDENAAPAAAPAEAATAAATPADPAAAPAATTPAADGKEFTIRPSTMITRDDGAIVADDRFVIKGKGTAAEPYEVTWEMLTSAEESYDPRLAKKQIPERIAMLDGKKVRITGYVAFPMYVVQPRELLAMLNQWDGCCIGVPPTPYDAIEVRLARAVGDDARMATYGSVEGTFAIKPYVVGDWLIGLYMMENAELKPTQFGGFGS